jgi:hypothetical protein
MPSNSINIRKEPLSSVGMARAYVYRRLCWRVANAFELQCDLIVLMCLISDTGVYGKDWLSLAAIEAGVTAKLHDLPNTISLLKPLRWYLEKALQARLVDKYSDCYRLTQLGLACVIDLSLRLTRHNAREWDIKWQQQRSH